MGGGDQPFFRWFPGLGLQSYEIEEDRLQIDDRSSRTVGGSRRGLADLCQSFHPEMRRLQMLHWWQHIEHLFAFPKLEDRTVENDKKLVPEMSFLWTVSVRHTRRNPN